MEGLRSLLDSAGDWRVVATENCLADLVDAVGEFKPELAVLDRSFGMEPVLGCIETLRDVGQGTAPIVWGASISEAEAVRLLQAGALGVVRKTCALGTLVNCIRSVASGGTWFEEGLIGTAQLRPRASWPPLTGRESQITSLVERNLGNREIAAELGIQVGTVKVHLRHIFEKTGIRGRHGLALSGLRAQRLTAMALM